MTDDSSKRVFQVGDVGVETGEKNLYMQNMTVLVVSCGLCLHSVIRRRAAAENPRTRPGALGVSGIVQRQGNQESVQKKHQ